MSLTVTVGGTDVTGRVDGLSCSATDPGGFEIAQLQLPSGDQLQVNAEVFIRDGAATVWHGRVAEKQDQSKFAKATRGGGCEGYRARFKDQPFPMIYVDRDLTHWSGVTVNRRVGNDPDNIEDPTVVPDQVSGQPSLRTQMVGAWGAAHRADAFYDAHGQPISQLYYAWKKTPTIDPANTGFAWGAYLSSDDTIATADYTGSLRAAGPGTGTLAAGANRIYVLLELFNNGSGGAEQAAYAVYWTVLAIYGQHGLPKRGVASFTDAQGFYPSDIARYVVGRTQGVQAGTIQDASGYVIPQLAYFDPTDGDRQIDDAAKFVGWHWGVWEPPTMFDTQPRLDFRPPPVDATVIVARQDCAELDLTSRLADLYDTANVTYTDVAGAQRVVTVTLTNPLLAAAGITGRPLAVAMPSVGTLASAQAYGFQLLALSQTTARAAGSAVLPAVVRQPGGQALPAHLVRPGLDRLRVRDLPDPGPITDTDTRRRDTFRIKRIETTWQKGGQPLSHVEIDRGSNLIETIGARLAAAATVSGG